MCRTPQKKKKVDCEIWRGKKRYLVPVFIIVIVEISLSLVGVDDLGAVGKSAGQRTGHATLLGLWRGCGRLI